MTKNHRKSLLLGLLASVSLSMTAQVTPLWLRDVKISPDGSKIAFTYKGDIWTVPTSGGSATRLTTTNSYEDHPVWSPDGTKIAFSSDRNGGFDIFVVSDNGGDAQRLTFNSANEIPEGFTPDGKEIIFSANLQDPQQSVSFPTARMTELYSIPVEGGNPTQIAAVPIQMPFFFPNDENIVYFQDYKGMEDEWRKHHTSSVTRDIWKWNRKDNSFQNITNRPGEDRNPVITPDGKNLIYIKEEPGKTLNVYTQPVDGSEPGKYITSFKNHPVRFLSIANNGLLCYTYDGEIYTQKPDQQPQKLNLTVVTDTFEPVEKMTVRGASDAIASPDGKSVAFVSRGDVFVTSSDYSTTKQITNTPEAEGQVSWSPDGKTLIYTSERDGHWNIYTAEMGRPDDANFANATLIVETPLFNAKDNVERTFPSYSPDGKKLAYIQDRNKLMVKDLKSGKVKQLLDGHTHLSREGGYGYEWSPDGQWIVTEGNLHHHDPYSDIFIVNTETAEMIPLTETGYFDDSPRFALDGEAVVFQSDRYGMRNHASWGSERDVMIVFLTQDAYDRFNLSEEDYKLLKEVEKANKKDKTEKDESSDKNAKSDKGTADKNDKTPKVVNVDRKNIQDRIIRLTPSSSGISDHFITANGETLYYIATANGKTGLWKVNLRDRKNELASNLEGGGVFSVNPKGNVLLITRGTIKKMDDKGKLTPVTFSAKQEVDHNKERNYMFDYVKRQEREMFYNKNMHGVDWNNLTEHYRKFLPHIADNYEFAEMLSELLGELNVSHTGGRYTHPMDPNASSTASLGLLFDVTNDNPDGLVVTEVLEGGPMDKAWSKIQAGDVVTEINGVSLEKGNDRTQPFNDIAGKKTLVKYRKVDGTTGEEVMVPVSKAVENALLYNRWVKNRAADVDKWSNGKLGYVHIPSMGDPSFRDIYADILGKYNDKEGIVIDIRHNGGGRLHEDIEVLFSGKKYLDQVIRDSIGGQMPSRRWNKPSIMVTSEACYSNAHGSPWVYQHQGLGKVVGAPVAGTMTSVNWVRMQDPTMVFGIPVTGWRLPDGTYLENTQLEPDVLILNTPENIMNGEDIQLKTAVEELLKEI